MRNGPHRSAVQKVHEACEGIRDEGDMMGMFNPEAIGLLFQFGERHDPALIEQLHLNGIYKSSEVIDYEKKLIDLADRKYQQEPPDYDGISNEGIRDEVQEALDEIRHEKYCIAIDTEMAMFDDGNDYPYYQSLLTVDDSYLLGVLDDVAKGLGSTEAP